MIDADMPKNTAQIPVASQPPDRLLPAYILGITGVIIFGATLPVTRLALDDFSPWFITFFRAGIAGLLAIIVLRAGSKPWRHKSDRAIFFGGLFLIFGFPGMMALGLQTVPASHGGVVLGFLPLATAALARLFVGETPSRGFWTLSIFGCLMVAGYTFFKADTAGVSGISIGDFWLILAGLAAAAGYVVFGKLSRETAGWEIIARALVLNLPLIIPGIWWFYEPAFLSPSTPGVWAMLYLGVFSMFAGFWAWNAALAWGGIARIGQLLLLQIFVTLVVAAILLGEKIDLATLTTAIVVTVIIALTRRA